MLQIRDRRILAGMTQSELARALGIERTTISMWENGKSSPLAIKLPDIARVLRCTVADLFAEDETGNIKNQVTQPSN